MAEGMEHGVCSVSGFDYVPPPISGAARVLQVGSAMAARFEECVGSSESRNGTTALNPKPFLVGFDEILPALSVEG